MSPSPYLFPGLTPPVTSVWIIPGYIGAGTNKPMIASIYTHVLQYFNKSKIDHNFLHRKRGYVMVRYWTMFISMSMGYTSSDAGSFFSKDHSTTIHAVQRIMGEISLYNDSSEAFRYFNSVFRFDPDNISSKRIKHFVKTWKNRQAI